jgi:ribosomal protein L11 methylase PrmA
VIASGILGEETDRVVSGFTLGGLREQARLQDGGWVALLFETA